MINLCRRDKILIFNFIKKGEDQLLFFFIFILLYRNYIRNKGKKIRKKKGRLKDKFINEPKIINIYKIKINSS